MYSACGPFNKNKKRIQKFKATGDSFIKARFQHDIAFFSILNIHTCKNEIHSHQVYI